MSLKVQRFFDWVELNVDALLLGALVAAMLVAAMLLLRGVGRGIVRRDPSCTTWKSVIARVLAKTSILFMIVAALNIVATYAEPPERVARLFDIAFVVAFALQGAVWARELILGVIGRRVEEDEAGESALANAMALIRVLVSVGLFAVAVVVILDNLGVNVTALIAGLGIGGIAIGLAAQGIFSDLFAALAILFDRPFRRGDTIRYGTSVGTVERIGLKTTRLRAVTGEQLIMANTKLLEQEIHNLAEGHSRRTTLNFGLVYQTPADKLARVPEIARQAVEARSGCSFIRCALTGFGPSSLDHELLYDNATLNPDAIAHDRSQVMMGLLQAFQREGIAFALPIQTNYTAAPDGTLIMPFPGEPAAGTA
ncbi:MAG TPA: mechanosensitive ion channel domain-containing protein [Sphingomicrobium sp.]|nr:mechanosensitive ion channel domain-containing protein [Sphingomicrobium sp.]